MTSYLCSTSRCIILNLVVNFYNNEEIVKQDTFMEHCGPTRFIYYTIDFVCLCSPVI